MNIRWIRVAALAAFAVVGPACADVYLSNLDLSFGTTTKKVPLTQSMFVVNNGDQSFQINNLNINGADALDFVIGGTSSCRKLRALAPRDRCRVDLVFTPTADGVRNASLKISTDEAFETLTVTLTGSGTGFAAPKDPYYVLIADPQPVAFGQQSASPPIALRNAGTGSTRIDTVDLAGRATRDFALVDTDCAGTRVDVESSCFIDLRFTPLDEGPAGAVVRIKLMNGDKLYIVLFGTGGAAQGSRVDVIEFYNAALDHYFISSLTPDIVANDTGANAGWARTGRVFYAFAVTRAGASPVCRFYIPPPLGNSHFYSASPQECGEVSTKFPTFTFEAPDVMFVFLPDAATGACPADSIPVYRVWNQRSDSNHRYTIDLAVRAAMLALGYVAEGYGPLGVAMCAPT
jgi:hypothetical protein